MKRTRPGSSERRALVLAACAEARQALSCIPAGETRPGECIDRTEAWAKEEAGVTLDDVRGARSNARKAYESVIAAKNTTGAVPACLAAVNASEVATADHPGPYDDRAFEAASSIRVLVRNALAAAGR